MSPQECTKCGRPESTWEGGAPVLLEPVHPWGDLVCEVCREEPAQPSPNEQEDTVLLDTLWLVASSPIWLTQLAVRIVRGAWEDWR